jgi:hypothetical protein
VPQRIVDINCVLPSISELGPLFDCDESWVVNDVSLRDDPRRGDDELLLAVQGLIPRVRPQIVLIPPAHRSGEVQRALDARARGGCGLVRLSPGAGGHRYPLVDWLLTPLPETCEREGLGLALDYGPAGSQPAWEDVVVFARAFPSVPIVVMGVDLEADFVVRGALDAAPNLLIELSGLPRARVLSEEVARFGGHRFLFGSRGAADPGDADRLVEMLSVSDKIAILSGNADSLQLGTWAADFL